MCVCVCVRERERESARACARERSVASVVLDSLTPHGLYLAKLLCRWNFPGKSIKVDFHFLCQGIFLTQESNPCFCISCISRWILFFFFSFLRFSSRRFMAVLFLMGRWILYHCTSSANSPKFLEHYPIWC